MISLCVFKWDIDWVDIEFMNIMMIKDVIKKEDNSVFK
jgi:hypothetical protein